MLGLHCGESKARQNTLQTLSKKFLANSWLPKASSMTYRVLFITKFGVTFDIPLSDPWTTLMSIQLHYITLYITYDYLCSTNDTWNFVLHDVYKNDAFSTYTHVGQNWLEFAWQENTKTQTSVQRRAHQPPLHDPRWWSNAMLGCAQSGCALFDDFFLETNSFLHFF